MACLIRLHLVLIIEATSKLRCISVVNCCIEEKNIIWNKRETKFASSSNISGLKYLLHKRIFALCWPLGGLDILTNRFWRRPVWNSNPNWAGSNWKSTSMVSFSLQAHRPPLLERWAWFWRGEGSVFLWHVYASVVEDLHVTSSLFCVLSVAIVTSLLNKDNRAGIWNKNLALEPWNIVNGKK